MWNYSCNNKWNWACVELFTFTWAEEVWLKLFFCSLFNLISSIKENSFVIGLSYGFGSDVHVCTRVYMFAWPAARAAEGQEVCYRGKSSDTHVNLSVWVCFSHESDLKPMPLFICLFTALFSHSIFLCVVWHGHTEEMLGTSADSLIDHITHSIYIIHCILFLCVSVCITQQLFYTAVTWTVCRIALD